MTHELGCLPLGVVGVQVFLQLQHTKLQSLQQATRDQLQQQDRTPHTLLPRQCTHTLLHDMPYRTHTHTRCSINAGVKSSLTVSASSSTVGHCERDVITSRELRNWLPIRWSRSPRKRTDERVMEPNLLWMLCVKETRRRAWKPEVEHTK